MGGDLPVPNDADWNQGADVAPYGYQPQYPMTDRPSWLELRPPYNPDSKLETNFSRAATPVRFLCIAILFSTDNVYKFLMVYGTILVIVLLIVAR